MCSKNEKNVSQKCGHTSISMLNTSCGTDEPVDMKLIDISSRILRLFVIDKQIQELMEEKTNIYNELLSQKEIASTLFNSWADNHLKQQKTTVNSESQQCNKPSEIVKRMCSRADTSCVTDQSKKFQPQHELFSSSPVQAITNNSGHFSNNPPEQKEQNCRVSCVSLSKLIGNYKENLSPIKKEVVNDVLNLSSSHNNLSEPHNVYKKSDSKSTDQQILYNKTTKNISNTEKNSYVTPENDSDKLLQRNKDLSNKNYTRETENSSSSIQNSSDKRKHCGDMCMNDGCNCKMSIKKKKKVEDAVDIIDFIILNSESSDSDCAQTGVVMAAPKISSVSKSNTGTPGTAPKCKSKQVTKEFEFPQKPVLCLKVRHLLSYCFIIYIKLVCKHYKKNFQKCLIMTIVVLVPRTFFREYYDKFPLMF